MWSGSLHNTEFVSKILEHLETSEHEYGTATRMKGMLTVAKEVRASTRSNLVVIYGRQELQAPFYFTPGKMAGNFHSICPPLEDVA